MAKRKSIGPRLVISLAGLLDDIKTGKPVRQSIVRRMTVKGETVHTRETFTAPVRGDRINDGR